MTTKDCINPCCGQRGEPDADAGATPQACAAAEGQAAELQRRTARLVHELRNPLHGILSAASLMRPSDARIARPDPQRLLDIIETSGQHMLKLLGEIIDVALSQDGELPVRPTPVELRRIVRESLDIVEPLASSKGVALSLDVASTIPQTVVLDSVRIKQVLVSLLANAIRFTDAGLVEMSVQEVPAPTDATDASGPLLRFDVRDNGVGMAENELLGLLTCVVGEVDCAPKEIVRRGGTGLGLSVCQSILKAMNSGLNMTSVPRYGTRAWFTVPA